MNQHLPLRYITEEKFDKMIENGYTYEWFAGVKYIEDEYLIYVETPKWKE